MTAATGPDGTARGKVLNTRMFVGMVLMVNIAIWLWLWPWFFDNYPDEAWDIFSLFFGITSLIIFLIVIIFSVFLPLFLLVKFSNLYFQWFSKEQLYILPKYKLIKDDRMKTTLLLFLTISILFSGSVYWFVWSIDDFSKDVPVGAFSLEEHPNGFAVTFVKVNPQVTASSIEWYILNSTGEPIANGNLKDGFGLNPAYRTATGEPVGLMSVHTNGSGGRVNPGTQIFFAKEMLPANTKNLSLRFKFNPTADRLSNDIPFANAIWNPVPFVVPTPSLHLTNRIDTNLSFDEKSTLSHSPILFREQEWQPEWQMTVYVNNTGDRNYTDITFQLIANNQTVASAARLEIPAGNVTAFTLRPDEKPDLTSGNISVNITIRFITAEGGMLLEGKVEVPVVRLTLTSPSFTLPLPLLTLSLLLAAGAQARLRNRRLTD